MRTQSVGELVKIAKGDDRSLREYARDSGVDAAIISKMINGSYIPKKPGLYESLTSPQASPRGGVTCEQLLLAAGASEEFQSGMSAGVSVGMLARLSDIPSSDMIRVLKSRGIDVDNGGIRDTSSASMKPEVVRRIQQIQSEKQRFIAIANGILLGAIGKCGITFQLGSTDNAEAVHFDTCVRLMNHDITDYLVRYVYISDEETASLSLIQCTMRRIVEELIFLSPKRSQAVAVVTNHPDAYDFLCGYKGRLSYNGGLSVLLFDPERAMFLREEFLAHYICEEPVDDIHLS